MTYLNLPKETSSTVEFLDTLTAFTQRGIDPITFPPNNSDLQSQNVSYKTASSKITEMQFVFSNTPKSAHSNQLKYLFNLFFLKLYFWFYFDLKKIPVR